MDFLRKFSNRFEISIIFCVFDTHIEILYFFVHLFTISETLKAKYA